MRKSLVRKGLVVVIIVLFVGTGFVPSLGRITAEKQDSTDNKTSFMGFNPRGDTLYVGGTGPGNYSSIQVAIDDANNGDTVFVFDDSSPYYENVVVDKSIRLIGENRETTVIDGGKTIDVVKIIEDDATLSDFTLCNSGSTINDAGIKISSSNNIISNCNICSNGWVGIYIDYSSNNEISSCYIYDNTWSGIRFESSSTNTITNNFIYNNGGGGISIIQSSNNQIISNTIYGHSTQKGVFILSSSSNNQIDSNNIYSNFYGILLTSSNNDIIGNDIHDNTECGIHVVTAQNCNIYHNNLYNNENAFDFGTNIWDDGYPSGGNYWDDYTGEDNNGDGIGDTPYDISGGNNQDLFPLMYLWGEMPPVANFTYEIDGATVTFDASSSYDPDGEIVTWLWDFDDGVEGAGEIVEHSYSEGGTFEVTLTVIDDDGYEGQITKSIEVEAEYEFETALLIGRITKLNTDGDVFTFDSVMVRYITFSPFSFNSYYSGETIAISQDYIGLVGARFIFALCSASFGMSPPTILFSQADQSATNTLTVISADPADMVWSDFDLQVDGIASDHGMSGTVTAGDIIDITAIAGTGAYTISLRHIPTNTLIGSWDFT